MGSYTSVCINTRFVFNVSNSVKSQKSHELVFMGISIFFCLLLNIYPSGVKRANTPTSSSKRGCRETMRSHRGITLVSAFTWPLWNISLPNGANMSSRSKILLANTLLLSARECATRTLVSRLNRFILLHRCSNQMNSQAGGAPGDSLPVWIKIKFFSWHKAACIDVGKLRRRRTWREDEVVKTD